MQAMEAKACNVHVLRAPRHLQQLQDARALPDLSGTDPARLASSIKLLEPFMPEAANHAF